MQKFVFLSLSLIFPFLLVDSVQAECSFNNSTYRAVDNSDFKLEITPYPPTAAIFATATITHPTRGELFSFQVTQSMYYGKRWFIDQYNQESKAIYGFDYSSEKYRGNEAPPYLFIAGLGYADQFNNQGNNGIYLGDTMWELSDCK